MLTGGDAKSYSGNMDEGVVGREQGRGSPSLVMGVGGVTPGKFLDNLYVVHEF